MIAGFLTAASFSANTPDMPLAHEGRSLDACEMPQSTDITNQLLARIATVRGKRVLLDSDLAALYGVSTKRFNEAVKRNLERFPADFSFPVEDQDVPVLRSQIGEG